RERRMVVWGGHACAARGDVNDCWALSLTGRPEWHELGSANEPPDARQGHTAIYDAANQQMVIFAGNATLNDTWALPLSLERGSARAEREEAEALTMDTGTDRVTLSSSRPNPFEAEATMTFALPVAGRVSVAVYDASGRRRRQLAEGVYGSGVHPLGWDRRDDVGRSAEAGHYFVVVGGDGSAVPRHLVLPN